MLPKWHIFWGVIFTAIIWFFARDLNVIYLSLIFLSTFLIDFDHYLIAARKNKHPSLKRALIFFEENMIEFRLGRERFETVPYLVFFECSLSQFEISFQSRCVLIASIRNL